MACVAALPLACHLMAGSVVVASVREPRAYLLYRGTITLSQALGTVLVDWTADTGELNYFGAALVFGSPLAVVAAAYLWTLINRVLLFWTVFILTRPLGAPVGDVLDKPRNRRGGARSRPQASGVRVLAIVMLILIWPLYPTGRRTA